MSRSLECGLLVAATLLCAANAGAQGFKYGYGKVPTPAEIAAADIDVRGPDGKGLPPGRGSVADGEKLFAERCVTCHGDFGEGIGLFPALAGGRGTLASGEPRRTVGSYWPYAPTLFDYVRRAMPFTTPGSLDDGQVYSLVAYVLFLNDLLAKDAVLDAKSLAAVRMPNRNGFTAPDPRPDVHDQACKSHCRASPIVITSEPANHIDATGQTPKR
jgi:S-disulfanyl-L-cysteine oxidoreductase SoxD